MKNCHSTRDFKTRPRGIKAHLRGFTLDVEEPKEHARFAPLTRVHNDQSSYNRRAFKNSWDWHAD